jgi:hypothetical protein
LAAGLWVALLSIAHPAAAQDNLRLDAGRFTVVADRRDERLAKALLTAAQANDTFPGLPRPAQHVLIALAVDGARFRALVGPSVPEWGAAIAIPDEQRIVMQGMRAGSDAGDPLVVLRHELAHLALHEAMGALPPRWFDEGYASVAAGEFTREQAFETSIGMVWRALPTLDQLENGFQRGGVEAGWSYALAHRVVSDLESLGGAGGLTNFLTYWKASGSFDKALREAYGLTGEAFEKHWRKETRRRYGALAVVTDISAALGLFSIILVPLFIQRRRRDRRRLEAMRAADAAQEAAARASALQAILDAGAPPPEASEPVDGASGTSSGTASGTASEPPPLPGPPGPQYPAA